MKTLPMSVVRTGLLFVGAAAVLAGHDLLTKQWIGQFHHLRAACGLASVTASMVVWLVTGVFVLPLLRYALRAGRSSHAASAAVGSALFVVSARAAIEAGAGVTMLSLPVFSTAAVIALVCGRGWLSRRPVAAGFGLRRVATAPPTLAMPLRLPRAS